MSLGWVLHDVGPEDLRPADHIYRWGSPLHNHHGIVLQILEEPQPPVAEIELQDRIVVLHFSLNEDNHAKVHSVPLRQFLECTLKAPLGGGLKRARYGCGKLETWIKRSGTCYSEAASAAADCLLRARSLLEATELRTYDFETLTSANCEHVAFWCKTGIWRSAQVDSARLYGAAAIAVGAAAIAGMRNGPAAGLVGLVGGVYLWNQANVVDQKLIEHRETLQSSGNRIEIHLPEADSCIDGDSQEVDAENMSLHTTPEVTPQSRRRHPRDDQELCDDGYEVLDTPKSPGFTQLS